MKFYLILIVLIPVTLFANSNIYFDHITQSNGLPSNDVIQIFQDSDGLMWFATYNGLASYDGYTFRIYNHSPTDSSTINHDLVLSITQENERYLWIGTYKGFCRYDKEQDNFKRFTSQHLSEVAILSIRKIVFDENGFIWLATNNGIAIYDQKKDSITVYTNDPDDDNSICEGSILEMYFDSNNQVWIGSRTGLDLFNRSSKIFVHLYTDQEFEKIISYKGGVLAITRTFNRYFTPSVTNIEFEEDLYTEDTPGFVFTDILTDYRGAEWYAIREYGLYIEDPESDEIINYTYSKYNQRGINSNVPQCLFCDKDDNLWIGTFDGGVNFYSPHRKVFHNLKDNFSETGLMNNKVKTIFQDRDGDIWIGTKVGGMLSKFDIPTQTFKHYRHNPIDPQSISDEYIFAITDAEPGYLWIGTMTEGLNHFNKASGKCKRYLHDPDNEESITSNNIKTLLVDDNILWISHHRQGLDKFDIKKGIKIKNYQFKVGDDIQGNIPSNTINKIFRDSQNRLWLLTDFGLSRYDRKSDSFFNYYTDENDSTSLSDNILFSVCEDSEKNLWFGSKNGLNKYNPASDNFKVFNTNNGLPSNAIYGIANDSRENLWISTNIGICRFDWKNENSRLYTVDDGLQNNEFVSSVYETSEDGYIFFGGNEGFTYFKPEEIKDNPSVNKILFTDFKIFNRSVKVGDDNQVLQKHISRSDHIELNHSHSVFSIEFTAINYNSTDKTQYAYMLEGFDDGWQYLGALRTVTYTNLNPGEYIFRAKATNNDGLWNEDGIQLSISVLPQWWQTLFFKIIALALIISLIVGFYYLRLNQLNKQKVRLAKQVKERTVEVEEKNSILLSQTQELNRINSRLEERQQRVEEQAEELKSQAEELSESNKTLVTLNATKDKFFSIIAHDLKNPFSTIMGLCEIILIRYDKYDDNKRKSLIKAIDQSSRILYRLLENLLQWARSQTGNIEYAPEEFLIKDILDNVRALVQNALIDKKLSLRVLIPPDYKIFADKNMMSTVFRNLLTNAIKYTEEGEIRVELVDEEKMITVKVIDSGIGMDDQSRKKVFEVVKSKSSPGTKGETGSGLGLIICRDFIEKHGGTIGVGSAPEKGSEFFFSIPKENNSLS